MPPALKAFLSQLAGWLIAALLVRSQVLPAELWWLVGAQAVAATAVALALRSARWWLPVHIAFSPLLVAANTLGVAPGWYLAVFIALTVVYWTSFRTQVPLYLSGGGVVAAVSELLPTDRPVSVLDLGSGTGALLIRLARLRPDCRFTGVEAAPGPYLVGRLLSRGLSNVRFERGDFFARDWSEYDVIYAFLSPVPMARVWRKARREMRPDGVLISNDFPVPDVPPARIVETQDGRPSRLYLYDRRCGNQTAE